VRCVATELVIDMPDRTYGALKRVGARSEAVFVGDSPRPVAECHCSDFFQLPPSNALHNVLLVYNTALGSTSLGNSLWLGSQESVAIEMHGERQIFGQVTMVWRERIWPQQRENKATDANLHVP
jgi:hypothetical protein